jgi:uncharacterized protein YggT (Ycf19 family)
MHYYILMKVYQGFDIFLRILQYILVAYCLMSWFASPLNRLFVLLSRMAQPIVAPFRLLTNRLVRHGLRIDISAIFAFFALSIARQLLIWFFNWLMTL